jgi:putative ABC transport system substrate-binding protein
MPAASATLKRSLEPLLKFRPLVIGPDSFFFSRSEQLGMLTLRRRVPAICPYRAFAAAGGLMSYGASVTDLYRMVGVYVGRILKGEKPADLPVQQPTKFEFIINMKTAKGARPHYSAVTA